MAESDEDDEDEKGEISDDDKQKCGQNCLINCLKVLVDYNLFSVAYETIYVVYKTVLTLPMTRYAASELSLS